MKLLFRLSLILSIALLQGCAVIHFENGEALPDPEGGFSWTFGLFEDDELRAYDAGSGLRFRKWYHHGVFQLAEISNPLETSEECIGLEWNQVTTEVTPFDAIMGTLDNALFINASSAWLDLWSPWSIEYSCRDPKPRR